MNPLATLAITAPQLAHIAVFAITVWAVTLSWLALRS